METEYALVAGPGEDSRVHAAESLMSLARRRLPHLRGAISSGIFLQNGARFYNDAGAHPELATAEVDSPEEMVRYLAAGDAELADLVAELRAARGAGAMAGMILLKSNICYHNPGVTWASHESFLHASAGREAMPRQLIPFLVSRVLFGSGGLNPLCPGILFSLSPRVHLFTRAIGDSTTGDRPIFNCRNESLSAGGMSRLHVIVGDSTHSQISQYIKIGSTALVVLLAELGLDPGGPMQLACPLIALHSFATDPHFRITADLVTGQRVTALDIQRHYLNHVEKHLDHRGMPLWAGEVCRRWKESLDLAERGPVAGLKMFDWALKLALTEQHLCRRAMKSETIGVWNHALTCVRDAHRKVANTWQFNEAILFCNHPAVIAERRNQEALLRSRGLRWDQAGEFLKVRAELCEIDVRCAQIMPAGLFAELAAHLPHTLIAPERIQQARREPPQGTRARFRGEHVRKYSGRNGCCADWQSVSNDEGMILDLTDPLVENPAWKPAPPMRPSPVRNNPINECAMAYESGNYAAAYTRASQILTVCRGGAGLPDDDRRLLLRLIAWTRARAGQADAAMAALDTLAAETHSAEMPLWLVVDYLGVMRKSTLGAGGTRFSRLIEAGERYLVPSGRPSDRRFELATCAQFLNYKGYALTRQGRAAEAVETLRRASVDAATGPNRIQARILADLGDALRMAGDTDGAAQALQAAERMQLRLGLLIDHADHTVPALARLSPNRREAYHLLRKAQRTLKAGNANVALARTLLLQARIWARPFRCARLRDQVTALLDMAPSLRHCPAVAHIRANWDAWIRGGADPAAGQGGGDPYWCL
jgi:proteasome accessory factor A